MDIPVFANEENVCNLIVHCSDVTFVVNGYTSSC